jgi:hypothetical protein
MKKILIGMAIVFALLVGITTCETIDAEITDVEIVTRYVAEAYGEGCEFELTTQDHVLDGFIGFNVIDPADNHKHHVEIDREFYVNRYMG